MSETRKIKVIADSVHGTIPLTYIEADEVLSTWIFNRLHNILQNSLAYLVYPQAKTSRFSHSIGVMHIASEMFKWGCINAKKEVFNEYLDKLGKDFEEIKESAIKELREVIEEEIYLQIGSCTNNFELTSISDLLTDNALLADTPAIVDDDKKLYYLLAFQSLRLGALLHDIGHLPFSHVLEYVLKSLFLELNRKPEDEKSKIEKHVYEILKPYFPENNNDENLKIHEILALDVVDYIFKNIIIKKEKEEYKELIKTMGNIKDIKKREKITKTIEKILRKIFLLILLCKVTKLILDKNVSYLSIKALREIIAGDLDADRIDFVARDGKSSGLLRDTADVSRIIKFITLVKIDNGFRFLPAIQALNDVEQLLLDRFVVYKYLVCHHKVVRFDYLLEKIVELMIREELESGQREKIPDEPIIENDLLQLIGILNKENNYRMYRFSQMDDFWLINILRGKYFNLLKSRTVNITETKEELLSLKTLLEELLTGSKNLISVWKRDHEYKEFVNDLYSDLVGDIKNSSDFKELAKTLPSLDNLQDEGFSGLQETILSVLESQDKYEWCGLTL